MAVKAGCIDGVDASEESVPQVEISRDPECRGSLLLKEQSRRLQTSLSRYVYVYQEVENASSMTDALRYGVPELCCIECQGRSYSLIELRYGKWPIARQQRLASRNLRSACIRYCTYLLDSCTLMQQHMQH